MIDEGIGIGSEGQRNLGTKDKGAGAKGRGIQRIDKGILRYRDMDIGEQ